MPYFPSLGDGATVRDILQLHPQAGRALVKYHEIVLRGPSTLSVRERELIAAYVSGLNACQYCHGVHSVTAEAFGRPRAADHAATRRLGRSSHLIPIDNIAPMPASATSTSGAACQPPQAATTTATVGGLMT